jgi:hypothetical protein
MRTLALKARQFAAEAGRAQQRLRDSRDAGLRRFRAPFLGGLTASSGASVQAVIAPWPSRKSLERGGQS